MTWTSRCATPVRLASCRFRFAAKSVIFRTNPPTYDFDWHVAPQRQFIVLLDGAIEIEVSDGTRRTLHGGEILLMEDTAGRGHRTRNVEQRERRSLFIVLDDPSRT